MSKFTEDDLRLIRAMCLSSNPQFPARPMYPAWQSVYDAAGTLLGELTECQCFTFPIVTTCPVHNQES